MLSHCAKSRCCSYSCFFVTLKISEATCRGFKAGCGLGPRSSLVMSRLTSSFTCQLISVIITTHHPSLLHSFTPGPNPTISTNPFHLNTSSALDCFQDHRTGPDLSCFSIYFYFVFSLIFLFVPCGLLHPGSIPIPLLQSGGIYLLAYALTVAVIHCLLCGPLRVAISWNGADVCLSVCLSVTCHISKTEPDSAIVTMDHYIEVGCN